MQNILWYKNPVKSTAGGAVMLCKKSRFEYKWIILVLCFLMLFFCAGFCCGNKGLYLAAITDALDIKRGVYTLTETFSQIASAVTSLFFGILIYRFGAKALVGVGTALACIAFYIYSVTDSIFGFYIGATLLGIGLCFLGTSMASTLIKRWFSADMGKFTGLVLAANGFGSALSAKIVSPMLYDPADPFGYRNVYKMFIPILIVLGLIFIIFLRNQPANGSNTPDAAPVKKQTQNHGKSNTKNPVFYFICISTFLFFMLIQSIYGTYAAYMKDVGLGDGNIATVASILTISFAAAKLLVGVIYDKTGLKPVLAMCQFSFVIAVILLIFLQFYANPFLAIIFALFMALSMPLETVCLSFIATDFFDQGAFEKTMGIFAAVGSAGAAVGSPVINFFFDITGTYTPIIVLWGILMLFIAIGYFKLSNMRKNASKELEETK